jgi:hypothetical protein
MAAFETIEDADLRRNFLGQKPFQEDKQERAFGVVVEGDTTDKSILSLLALDGRDATSKNVTQDIPDKVLLQDCAGSTPSRPSPTPPNPSLCPPTPSRTVTLTLEP